MAAQVNTYEFTYIINAALSDDQLKDVVSRVSSFVTDNGGEIIEVAEWGSQRLAYPINKKRNGAYVNMYFRAPGEMIQRLERTLEINDSVLRYLTLKMDAKMLRHFEGRKDRAAALEAAAETESAQRT
jgi:small subunit ribosomal protein S6